MTKTFLSAAAGVVLALAFPVSAFAQDSPGAAVTFTKDIAPILQRSCQKCHRPNSLAPMSLIDYEEVRPWARAMKQRTGLRDKPGVMPPWFIEKDIGIQQFKNDPSLSDAEVAKIAAWADHGAPRGDPADLPPPVAFIDVNDWEIGEPDLIVSSPSVDVKAEAPGLVWCDRRVADRVDRGSLRCRGRVQGSHGVSSGSWTRDGGRTVRGPPCNDGRCRSRR